MQNNKTLVAIMCGGSGTRLWPLVRENYPKQFIDLDNSGLTIFQKTVLRGRRISNNLLLIGNFAHRFIILEQLRKINLDTEIDKTINIILEPIAKNTLSTSIIASLFARKNSFKKVLLLPSDQIMKNEGVFLDAVKNAGKFLINKSGIVTFGITPTFANTEYGYIEKTNRIVNDEIFLAGNFTEKPIKEVANQYLANQAYLWNSGIFFFHSEFFLKKVAEFEPENFEIVSNTFEQGEQKYHFMVLNEAIFQEARSDSIDFAVMQKLDEIFCIELKNSGWRDLGSFSQIYDISPKDDNANLLDENVYTDNVSNCHVVNSRDGKIILSDVDNLLIVSMDDILSITKKDGDGNKRIFEKLKSLGVLGK